MVPNRDPPAPTPPHIGPVPPTSAPVWEADGWVGEGVLPWRAGLHTAHNPGVRGNGASIPTRENLCGLFCSVWTRPSG
jgi:hypothetical protein